MVDSHSLQTIPSVWKPLGQAPQSEIAPAEDTVRPQYRPGHGLKEVFNVAKIRHGKMLKTVSRSKFVMVFGLYDRGYTKGI